jgi:ABC-type methionine transport system permease subunit
LLPSSARTSAAGITRRSSTRLKIEASSCSARRGRCASLGLAGGGYLAYTYGWQITFHTIAPVAVVLVLLIVSAFRALYLAP